MRAVGAITLGLCVWAMWGAAGVSAQGGGTLSVQVVDSLGARVAGASVTLTRDGSQVAESKSSAEGTFTFSNLTPGRYQVTATAQGFQPRTSEPVYAGPGARPIVEIPLEVGALQQLAQGDDVVAEPLAEGVVLVRFEIFAIDLEAHADG